MSKVWINKSTLTDIANAIRSKKGSSALIDPSNFANEIQGISGGGSSIANSFTVNFYNVDNALVEMHTAKCGNLVGSPLSISGGKWTDSDGNNIVFPTTSDTTAVMNLYWTEIDYVNDFYKLFGVDKNEYPYFIIVNWFSSNPEWRIKPLFAKSISDDGGTLYDCLCMTANSTGLGGYYAKSINSEEYASATYYSDIEMIFDVLANSGATMDGTISRYPTDNDTNKCWFFTNYDTTVLTNWTDLRTL